MLYVQQFQHQRHSHLNEYERLRSAADRNFLLCSNQYIQKSSRSSQPPTRALTPNPGQRSRTLLILGRIQSIVSLNNSNDNTDLSVLKIKATSWNPHQSRITRENKDYMTALAKGLTRPDAKIFSNENSEIFSTRWHQNLSNNVCRPGTGKPGSRNSRPPTSAPEHAKATLSSLIEIHRPTTAPVVIEARPRRIATGKMKSAAPTRSPPPPAPPALLRAPRIIDSSGNFDNLISSTFLQLTDGLKSSIYKSDNHFVHQLCSTTNESLTDQLDTSHESFLDVSNRNLPNELAQDKRSLDGTSESDKDENQNDSFQHIANLGLWQRDMKSGRIEAVANIPQRKTPHKDPEEIERRIVEQEEEELRRRQTELEQYEFDLPPGSPVITYDFKSPFTEEYDQAISLQTQIQTMNGNNEWNLKEFYRDVQVPFEEGTNTKAVFEKCLKLARLQASTVKWEQRRRQNLNLYNRLMKANSLDTSTSNLTGSFTTRTNNTDKDLRELNDLKRELRCNECKRVTCLGNCAPGQDYHLYKRIVSSIPSQSSSRQPSLVNGSNPREQHRCKHGCTTCSANNNRTTADIINANAIMTSLSNNTNNNNNNNNNRLRSSKTTYSFGQKSQRPPVDLRPRSMHQVTREMKLKFEQASLSPVVVVPLYENASQTMLTKRSAKKSSNGLLPGKSFRSQRRDSLTLVSPQKVNS